MKKARYEQEKVLMETLRGLGNAVGEYIGDGQGESGSDAQAAQAAALVDENAEPGVDDQLIDEEEDLSDNPHPLLFFYDCETTGFSIYDDHITEIAAKVVACPIPLQAPTFSSLVRTSRRIPAPGL